MQRAAYRVILRQERHRKESRFQGSSAGQPNETTFQLTLTCLRLKYSPSKGHESKFWT
uniref:Uncharacterized protein n=1 Tax=Candidatus Kentrum sp. LPFa TaxID=2126335 RepID=A0A450X9C3_9GAMM|nr:MAG: hypothetical protein BECKLPF1236C_GA0070990_1002715 [Candidatus Kentron sp. LPFa]